MSRDKLIDLLVERFDRLEQKLDVVLEEKLPALQLDQAVLKREVRLEAKSSARVYGVIYGGITLMISLAGVALAYFKK